VLVYHGIGEPSEFTNAGDSAYGLSRDDFARQMALLDAGGFEAISLQAFQRFHAGERVRLPARPLLLTFDDARADSYQGADSVLEKLGWQATMFVDVGAVTRRDRVYSTWDELRRMQSSERWELQLHSGRGHRNIRYGTDSERDVGPYYAYRDARPGREETFADYTQRVTRDLAWGERELRRQIPGYRPLAFAPPYGNFGQLSTNDPRIPRFFLRLLKEQAPLVFLQQPARYARPRDVLVPRFQLTRRTSGGELRAWFAENASDPAEPSP
jgi:peptidoglycan/xylan/chitin deacetylase (PgdA/CDA1 family)